MPVTTSQTTVCPAETKGSEELDQRAGIRQPRVIDFHPSQRDLDSWPSFETPPPAALRMRSGLLAKIDDLILRSERSECLEGWPRAEVNGVGIIRMNEGDRVTPAP